MSFPFNTPLEMLVDALVHPRAYLIAFQYSVGDAVGCVLNRVVNSIAFNTPLEMLLRGLQVVASRRHIFQYSVGDAGLRRSHG